MRPRCSNPDPHSLLHLAAQETGAHTAGLPPGGTDTQLPPRRGLPPVRTLTDLPGGTAHLVALLSQRGATLTATEARAVTRALLDGVQLTAQVLTAAHDGSKTDPQGPAAVAPQHLQAALPRLQHRLWPGRDPDPTSPRGAAARPPDPGAADHAQRPRRPAQTTNRRPTSPGSPSH